MTDHTTQTAVRSIDSLASPEELLDDETIPVETKHRELEDEQFEALQERYDAMAGVVQFAITTDDGELLMQGWDGASAWAPPGGDVKPGEDWIAGAEKSATKAFGIELDIDGVLLVEELIFERADGDEEFSSYGVSFGASLADDDSEFLDDPSFPPESPLADEDMVLRWVTEVPEDINENHREHIEQFLAYAQNE